MTATPMDDAQVRQYLADNGYPEHVVREGLPGLLRRWEAFVEEVERGYGFTIFDYRNELDGRAILALAGFHSAALQALDERFRRCLERPEIRVWESAPGDPWWDFGIPRNAGEDLLEDLRGEGILP